MTKSIDDTIAAVATPPGQGGIAIVRLSGPESFAIASRMLASFDGAPLKLSPRRASLGRAIDSVRNPIDEVLAIAMPGPHSHTREDVVEIHSHGGRVAANLVLGRALALGARLAEPGEFTLRAFLRGRIDLVQAEAVADVIGAVSSEALKVHEELLGGALSAVVAGWQNSLGGALALLESQLDFPEDDLEAPDLGALVAEVSAVAAQMKAKLESFAWGRVAREGFRVAVVGLPNVGKSSLLNAMLGEERAITSPHPGTTRDTIEATLNAFGAPVHLVDTAGLRDTGDEIEELGVARARRAADAADLVLFVLDGSREMTCEEAAEAGKLAQERKPHLLVSNKADLRAVNTFPAAFESQPLFVSAKTGEGVEALLCEIRDRALSGEGGGDGGVLTRERHRAAVAEAHEALRNALASLAEGNRMDAAASEMQRSRNALRALLGWGTPEDVLDRIFSEFCIGK